MIRINLININTNATAYKNVKCLFCFVLYFLLHHNCYYCHCSLLGYTEQYADYDPFLSTPDPTNPWISDDTTFWELEARCT